MTQQPEPAPSREAAALARLVAAVDALITHETDPGTELLGALYEARQLARPAAAEPGWRPVDLTDPPDECPRGCGCRWREDADRTECGCDGPCCGLGGPDGGPDPEWEARPDPGDEPPKVDRAHPPVVHELSWAPSALTMAHFREATRDVPGETMIIMASDAEGNNYSPLATITASLYLPETTWYGEAYALDREPVAPDDEHENAPEGAFPVIELGPVN